MVKKIGKILLDSALKPVEGRFDRTRGRANTGMKLWNENYTNVVIYLLLYIYKCDQLFQGVITFEKKTPKDQ